MRLTRSVLQKVLLCRGISRNNTFIRSSFKPFSSVSEFREYNDFEFRTLVEMQEKACAMYKERDALGTRRGDLYDWMTYSELSRNIQKFRNVLQHIEFKFDDKVAIISNNREEWPVCAYATMGLGGQIVPMYESQQEKDWKFIIEDSDSKVLIVATDTIYQKVKDFPHKVGKVEAVILLDGDEAHPASYKRWMSLVDSEPPVAALGPDMIKPESLSTIIYTSGTTGRPKGVELSHRNIQSGVYGGKHIAGRHLGNLTSLAFLPWAHIFGMTAELHSMFSTGSRLAIVPHRDQILQCLLIAKPDLILSVPVLFNKVYDGVMKATAKSGAVTQYVFRAAMAVARRRNHKLEFGERVGVLLQMQHALADKLVLSKIRAKLGNNLQFMISGGAATSQSVLEFFEDIGVPVIEGYGLTETSPAISAGSIGWENRRLGCAGVPLDGVTVRIVDPEDALRELPADTDGEITCSGPNVMVGYRKNPAANAEAFYHLGDQRFFRTGDMGRMVEGRFLKITGRIKEQFKLENGKFVIPAPMEDTFCRSPFISQVFIYGQDKPHTVALVVPDFVELGAWAEAHKGTEAGREILALLPSADRLSDPNTHSIELFKHAEFRKLISSEFVRVGASLKSFEKPLMWTAITQHFSQENQMLTPKMSLRRANILKAYQPMLLQLYDEHRIATAAGGDAEIATVEGHFKGTLSSTSSNVGTRIVYKK